MRGRSPESDPGAAVSREAGACRGRAATSRRHASEAKRRSQAGRMERTSGRVNSSVRSLGASVLLVLLAAHAVHAQSAPTTKPAARPTGDDIATVGTRHVPRAQYEARVQNAANAFQARNGSEIPSAMTG